jgi:hypothetical protein
MRVSVAHRIALTTWLLANLTLSACSSEGGAADAQLAPSGAGDDGVTGDDVMQSNCWWKASKSACGKGLSVGSDDGGLSLTGVALASGSDLLNAGVVPSTKLPFDLSTFHGAPDLGPVER